MSEFEVGGKSIILMGASGGMGRHLAAELAARGAKLTLAARHREKLDELDVEGVRVAADITSVEDCERVVSAALEAYGALDGVINAAGVVAFGRLADTPPEIVRTLFEVDALGPLYLIQAAVPHMEQGFICNVTAVVAERPMAGLVPYCAAKAALSAATRALGRELRRKGGKIRVIDVRPPHTETGLAGRPIAGAAPRLPTGLPPEQTAHRIVKAIEEGEEEVPSQAFNDA
jgi:cyclic-di-GMP-binding biofilm dispersal mediator protein